MNRISMCPVESTGGGGCLPTPDVDGGYVHGSGGLGGAVSRQRQGGGESAHEVGAMSGGGGGRRGC